jgi:hypothetical protein
MSEGETEYRIQNTGVRSQLLDEPLSPLTWFSASPQSVRVLRSLRVLRAMSPSSSLSDFHVRKRRDTLPVSNDVHPCKS